MDRPPVPVTVSVLTDLHELRDTLRALAAANATDEPAPRDAVEAFNRVVAPHVVSVRLEIDGGDGGPVGTLVARESTGGAVATLAAAVHRAVLTGTWTRLKSCANPECRWLYYDGSRSRTARWCTMRACGSVTKARRYRERRRARETP